MLVDERLTEWHLARRWAGHLWESLDEAFPGELTAYLEHPDRMPFSSESLDALAGRVAGTIRRHRAAAPGPLVVVSHQDPIQAARLALTGRSLRDLHRGKPGHGDVIVLDGSGEGSWEELGVWSPE